MIEFGGYREQQIAGRETSALRRRRADELESSLDLGRVELTPDEQKILLSALRELMRTGRELGKGSTSRVITADTMPFFRGRICVKALVNPDRALNDAESEFELLEYARSIQGVRVPKPLAVIKDTSTRVSKGEPSSYLLMQTIDGMLLSDILQRRKRKVFTEDETDDFERQLRPMIAMMHTKGLYHRDLGGLNNILKDNNTGELYIIDFGSAKRIYFSDEYDTIYKLRRARRSTGGVQHIDMRYFPSDESIFEEIRKLTE